MENDLTLYIISGTLALIPAAVWFIFLFNKSKRTSIQILIFLLSIFSVIPIIVIQLFIQIFPQFDILTFLQSQIHNQNINYIILFISVGIVEEIVKQLIVRLIDKKYLLIQTINDSIHYSLIAALGFAFTENILYIIAIYSNLGINQLIVPYLFRSLFTTGAHLIFSGFFGYYYGIAKFSLKITEQSRWVGKKNRFATFVSNALKMSRLRAIKEITILKGLFVAIIMHAIFNLLLQFNQLVPVSIYIIVGFLLLIKKLKQKTGQLILITDSSEERTSSMPKKDQDVVIELLGMWFKDKRYVDVLHICERLMERDPNNKVIQLFKAKALDKMDQNSAYGKILKHMFPSGKKTSIVEMLKQKAKEENKVTKKTINAVTQTETSSTTSNKKTFKLDI